MPRKPNPEGQAVHTAIRLPAKLHEELLRAAEGRTISDEIKRRLEASFATGDGKTRFLLEGISRMIATMEQELPPWHENTFSRDALRAGISDFLASLAPEGEPKFERKADATTRMFSADDTLDQIGLGLNLVGHGVRL